MTGEKDRRPQAVMMSKRSNMFYLEHVRIMQKNERVVYLTETGQSVEQIINIPDKNTSFLLLGKGTSITDAAARMLAESNVVVGFTGSGGSPLISMADMSFLVPQDEYRPTEYMQAWARLWFNETSRLDLAKRFLMQRITWDVEMYAKTSMPLSQALVDDFHAAIEVAQDTQHLLSAEGRFAMGLYAHLSRLDGISFARKEGQKDRSTKESSINAFLDHGNYIAYGYAAVALHTMGISYAFPVLHGKTRRGALVFDVADLIKDWLVMPLAFEAGAQKWKDQRFRAAMIDNAIRHDVLDKLMGFIKEVSTIVLKIQ